MEAKRLGTKVLGGIEIAVGCILLLGTLRILTSSHASDPWTLGGDLMTSAVSIYLVYVGQRGIRYPNDTSGAPRFGWSRILLGALLIFVTAKNHYDPAPNLLKASNAGEAVGMAVTAVAICLLGTYLLVRGIRAGIARN